MFQRNKSMSGVNSFMTSAFAPSVFGEEAPKSLLSPFIGLSPTECTLKTTTPIWAKESGEHARITRIRLD